MFKKVVSTAAILIGTLLMGAGAAEIPNPELGYMILLFGFIAGLAGMIGLYQEVLKQPSKIKKKDTDRIPFIRMGIAALTAFTLLAPYIKLPLSEEGTRKGYSALTLATTYLNTGEQIQDGVILVMFMAVVLAGVFLSMFHHIGGYLIILATIGLGYLIMISLEISAIDVILYEFEFGLYLALIGAFLIIVTGFLKSTVEMASDTDW